MKPLFFILEFNSLLSLFSIILLVLSIATYVITIKISRKQKKELNELKVIMDQLKNVNHNAD